MKNVRLNSRVSLLLAAVLLAASLLLSAQPKPLHAETGSDRIAVDFEDGTTQGWYGRGGVEALTATAAAAHSGAYGLQVAGRTQSWNGPQLEVTPVMQTGKTYEISAWLRLPAGMPASSVSMTVQRTTDGSDAYEFVAAAAVTDAGWVQLTGQYQLLYPAEKLAVYFEAPDNPTSDFYVDDFLIERNPDPEPIEIQPDIPALKDTFAGDFKLGTALLANEIADPDGPDAQLIKKHFNSLTPGNELKWDATEPQEGQFNFTRADQIFNFAQENGIAFRGHTLIWHSQTPDWVFHNADGTLVSKDILFQRMKLHIEAEVGRYKGKVYAWDVVNEIIEPADGNPGGLRNSLWYQIAGEEYIEKAFQYAHEADPDAELFINDYNTHQPEKRQDLHDLIKRLKDKGVPVDGIGHQMHIDIQSPSVQDIDATIGAFEDLGIDQQITELDMSVYTNSMDAFDAFPSELQIKQANRYRDIFDVFRKHKDRISAVVFWGKDDLNTWLRTFPVARNNWPLLFDERLQAKYAYWALVDPGKVPVETRFVKASAGKPVIDGKPDVDWSWAQPVPIMKAGQKAAEYKTLWSAGRLYIWVNVFDATANGNDAVDVFIDGNNGKTSVYEADDKKYTFRRSGANPQKPADYKAVKVDGGYRIEASVPIACPALGKTIGFDMRINDRSGNNVTQTSWNDTTDSQNTNTSNFGELTFVQGPRSAVAMRGTPVIDGVIDNVWNRAHEAATDLWVTGSGGSTAKVRTLWDAGRLYILAEVNDTLLSKRSTNAWEQDSVELFVDPNNGKTAAYESGDGQYRISFDNEQSVNPASLSGNLVSAATRTVSGYIVEASVAWPGNPPRAGDWIGFDVQVNNDEDDDGDRDSVAIWNDTSGLSYQDTSGFGVMELK